MMKKNTTIDNFNKNRTIELFNNGMLKIGNAEDFYNYGCDVICDNGKVSNLEKDGTHLCRFEASEETSLCWLCKKSVPNENYGCSWSINFKPIFEWNAKYGPVDGYSSYFVFECPQFTPDINSILKSFY